jgi:hypothetical protein
VEELPLLVNVKRRCLLGVKRAEAFPAPGARPLELHELSDDLDEVGALPNVVDFFPWKQRQTEPAPLNADL